MRPEVVLKKAQYIYYKMNIKDYFFSKNNILLLTSKLAKDRNVSSSNKDAIYGCKQLVTHYMNLIYSKNEEALQHVRSDPKKVIAKLNGKTLDMCRKYFEEKESKSSHGNERSREKYVNVKRRQPQQKQIMENDDSAGGYASFTADARPGSFISATGSIGNDMMATVEATRQMYNGGDGKILGGSKRDSENEIERRLAERAAQYDGGGYGGDMQGYGGGMQGYGGGMQGYGGNNSFGRQRPPEIDLSSDGSGLRRNRDDQGNPLDNDGYQMNGFGGMPGFNGGMQGGMQGGFNGMDPSMGNFSGLDQYQSNYGDNGDIMSRVSQYQNEGNFAGNNMTRQQMNPQMQQMNPQMMQQMNPQLMMQFMQMMQNQQQNFPMGGRVGEDFDASANLNHQLKSSLASQLGVNLQSLQSMDSSEIGKLVENATYMTKHNDNPYESDDERKQKKHSNRKLEMLNKLKQLMQSKSKNSNSESEQEQSDSDDSDKKSKKKKQPVPSKQSNNKKSLQKKTKDQSSDEESQHSSSDDESKNKSKNKSKNNSDDDSEKDSEEELRLPKQSKNVRFNSNEIKKNIENNKKVAAKSSLKKPVSKASDKSNNKTLQICCDKIVDDPADYNDYMVVLAEEMGEKLKNVSEIKITGLDIPVTPNINDTCNTFSMSFDDMSKNFVFGDGKYTIAEIIDTCNEQFEQLKWNIIISADEDNKLVFENSDEEPFKLDFTTNSIGKFLGFTKDVYDYDYKYVAENTHAFVKECVHLFIKNIDNENPIAIIHCDGSFDQKITTFSPAIGELPCLVLQFRNDVESEEDDKFEFYGMPHKINFKFSTK